MPRRRYPTYIGELEEVVEEVAEWGDDYIDNVVDTLAPDGRPFNSEKLSPKQEMDVYLTLRSNPEAWKNWVAEKQAEVVQLLQGQPDDVIQEVRPWEVVFRYAWAYSAKMEGLLAKQGEEMTVEPR